MRVVGIILRCIYTYMYMYVAEERYVQCSYMCCLGYVTIYLLEVQGVTYVIDKYIHVHVILQCYIYTYMYKQVYS